MKTYQLEEAWKEIRIGDLVTMADAMLESNIDVRSLPLENGAKAKINIRFTRNPEYLGTPQTYFRMLRSLTTLFEKVAPGERFSTAHFRHDEAEFEVNVTYRPPVRSARYVGQDVKSFMKSMALFEVASILSQALVGTYYFRELKKRFPDPRHKWESAIRTKIPFLDNAVRIYVPERPKRVPFQNREYFD
ncbi:hypothetical protein [Ralstonia pickettii]|uniref:hypothetical protein n=1 Tax=Ralstonia pickettii TaxID=329 RepID=UPI002D77DA0D|nr:hypothetical protein [Ralstonia pickettii]